MIQVMISFFVKATRILHYFDFNFDSTTDVSLVFLENCFQQGFEAWGGLSPMFPRQSSEDLEL